MHKQSQFVHLPEAFTQSDLQGHFRHLPLRRMTPLLKDAGQSQIEPSPAWLGFAHPTLLHSCVPL